MLGLNLWLHILIDYWLCFLLKSFMKLETNTQSFKFNTKPVDLNKKLDI